MVGSEMSQPDVLSPLRWESGCLWLLDQLRLPAEEIWVPCRDEEAVAQAIRTMVVRGAPAIGCAAAFGVALAGRTGDRARARRSIDLLAGTRPTAVNLFWALEEMRRAIDAGADLEGRAVEIWRDDIDRCLRIGRHGASLVPDGATILTHCNAGALATGGYGTALGVVRAARAAGKGVRILADETRPFDQGARLTAWELRHDGFEVEVIPDNAAPWILKSGRVQLAVVGADRIARNGDTANKIGTYGVALACREHGVPFYVAAPASTVDLDLESGDRIPIEERPWEGGRYPAFDVTPARLITAIITERGVFRPPYDLKNVLTVERA
jgi:methylthioribose-1-phosphate isomerase